MANSVASSAVGFSDKMHQRNTEHIDVLIISPLNDIHALVVSRQLEALGLKALLVDTSEYLHSWRSECIIGQTQTEVFIHSILSNKTFDISNLKGVWYRRLWPFSVDKHILDKDVQEFAYNECRDFIHGLLAIFPNVINDPAKEWAANRKVMQLHAASMLGLNVPKTIISSEPNEVKHFQKNGSDDLIFKPLTNTVFQFTETRRLEDNHWAKSDAMRLSPVIFQERISGKHHLRVTVVDDSVFSARLSVRQSFAENDWRLDPTRSIVAADLDADTSERLIRLMKTLGLRYGAVDFIVSSDDTPYFLEVNPSGQFLFCEIHADLLISKAIALALSGVGCNTVAN